MRSERFSVFVVFVLNGLIAGSWAPRMPALADQIGAGPGMLGLVLFGAPVGLAAAASFAGQLCARFGARIMVLVSAVAAAGVLPLLALVRSPWQLGIVLILLGASFGLFDVSNNVAAMVAIRHAERPLMPVFHAGFSFGALGGSLLAAAAAGSRLALLPYFALATAGALIVISAVIRFVPRQETSPEDAAGDGPRTAVRRPALWLLGLVAFCAAIAEGASYDWSAFFAVHERGMSERAGAVMFSAFCLAMGVVRLTGERIQHRFGPVRMLVGGSVLGGAGLLLAATVPAAGFTYAGYLLAGCGLAFGFPVVLDLAGAAGRRDDGTGGEREIGFVTTVSYTGFLLGPPLVGGLAQLANLSVAIGFTGIVGLLIGPLALASLAARRREKAGMHEVGAAP
ncbi:MFS transporter [Catenuloplanes sp. NPDC051500]|uniref:MFS transporter n=1 Tax=Catenuloplanes sp. NPDC051500 TaxID=3363959 RepID=UPI0037A7D654